MISEISKNYNFVEKLGRSCSLVQRSGDEDKLFILKSSPDIIYFKQRISRFLFGGSLPFQNEFRVLDLIDNYPSIPHLPIIEKKNNLFYMLPFINNAKDFETLEDVVYEEIGKGVAEISKLSAPKKWFWIKEVVFQKMESPSLNFRKNLAVLEHDHQISTNNFDLLYLKIEKLSDSIRKRLIHNDLGDNNIIVSPDNNFYFIDWEDAHLENRAIFLDLISASFNYKDYSLNPIVVKSFWKNYNIDGVEKDNLVELFSYSYVIYLYKLMRMTRFDDCFKHQLKSRIKDFSKNLELLFKFSLEYINMKK